MATEPPLGVIGAVGLPLSGLRMGHDINNARYMTERRDHVGFDRGDIDAQRPSNLGIVYRLNPVEQEHLSRPTRKAHDRIGVDVQRVARIEGSFRPKTPVPQTPPLRFIEQPPDAGAARSWLGVVDATFDFKPLGWIIPAPDPNVLTPPRWLVNRSPQTTEDHEPRS